MSLYLHPSAGNDMRNVSAESLAILKNADAIAVNQDPLGQMGIRITPDNATQVRGVGWHSTR
jgi:alpha-galactosidase